MSRESGVVVWRGKSRLGDGGNIVVIVTGLARQSLNSKTGRSAQVWILRSDRDPLAASRTGKDSAICGDCPHKGTPRPKGDNQGLALGRACYVTLHQAPLAIWRTWKRGGYRRVTLREASKLLRGRYVRLGAYGDPGAVPLRVISALVRQAGTWTGYTHAWRNRKSLQNYCMASVDSDAERIVAQSQGWRTFRVRASEEALAPNEITCPASAEAGYRVTCSQCKLCRGNALPGVKSIAIVAHGNGAGNVKRATISV